MSSLDAGARALLDLSLRRGLSDAELAPMLHATPEAISKRRADLLDRLGAAVSNGGVPETDQLKREVGQLLAQAPSDGPASRFRPGAGSRDDAPGRSQGQEAVEEPEPLGHWRTVRRLTIAVVFLTMLLVASLIVVAGLLVWN